MIAVADILDGRYSAEERLRNLLRGLVFALAMIGQEQDASASLDASGGVPRRNQVLKLVALRRGKVDRVVLRHNTPSIPQKPNFTLTDY